MSLFTKIFGDISTRSISEAQKIVTKINALESSMSILSDEELKKQTEILKNRLHTETLDDILPEAFAVLREAAKRTLGMRHFDVQLIGGIMIHQGKIAEMRTGEGKTLVATLPLYLNALSGKGVHLVTVNDYLSRRDAVWMGQIFDFLGLSVGIINSDASYIYDAKHIKAEEEETLDEKRDDMGSFKIVYDFLKPCSRKDAYLADITYGTNNEFGFDYLRDNIATHPQDIRQREYSFAIVDEVDSILIDEARTPLIISAPTQKSENLYVVFAKMVSSFIENTDYTVDEKHRSISLSDQGIEKAEKALGVENIYTDKGMRYVHHLETAVRAKALFHKDKQYVVRDGEVVIVDEFTGRLQNGRRWSEGLHQAVEAKEGVVIKEESRTYASITFQNYFRLYKKLSGMTGTADTSREEFLKVYGLDTIVIPPYRTIKRIDYNDLIFQNESGKFKALAKKVKELHKKGQPVLIGTVSIEKNELLSLYLKKEGVPHEVLNAKNHEREGEIIAGAGRYGAVTIATNMAGRGVDIKLGGIPFSREKEDQIKNLGGLFVLGTERHEARRIDNQLRGRSGRQGDPGETQFYVSLEDDLMRVFASDLIKRMMVRFDIKEDEAIENRLITKSLETAQNRIEGFHFDSRKHTLEYDDVLNHQRRSIYDKRRKILLSEDDQILNLLVAFFKPEQDVLSLLHKKEQDIGRPFILGIKGLMLQTIDMFWMDHLEMMDYLRGSVNLRAYGQRDPLVEYKKEGLRLFKEMEAGIADTVLHTAPLIGGEIKEETFEDTKSSLSSNVVSTKQATEEGEIGRNDPCFCGSGKKYKKCHGK